MSSTKSQHIIYYGLLLRIELVKTVVYFLSDQLQNVLNATHGIALCIKLHLISIDLLQTMSTYQE